MVYSYNSKNANYSNVFNKFLLKIIMFLVNYIQKRDYENILSLSIKGN